MQDAFELADTNALLAMARDPCADLECPATYMLCSALEAGFVDEALVDGLLSAGAQPLDADFGAAWVVIARDLGTQLLEKLVTHQLQTQVHSHEAAIERVNSLSEDLDDAASDFDAADTTVQPYLHVFRELLRVHRADLGMTSLQSN